MGYLDKLDLDKKLESKSEYEELLQEYGIPASAVDEISTRIKELSARNTEPEHRLTTDHP